MFKIRKTKPEKGNKFYTRTGKGGYNTCVKGNPTDDCDALANCVGYAEGRPNEVISELAGKDMFKYNTLYCNAENFIEKALTYPGVVISDVPVKGGILVWQKGKTLKGNDGAGHVEFVEEVTYKEGTLEIESIYTSGSNYGAEAFFNARRTNSNGRWGLGSAYKFRGCIVLPELAQYIPKEPVKPEPKPEPTPAKKEIKEGDTVIVNGFGTASSTGEGAKTKVYKDTKMKVIGISTHKERPNRYALNQYNKGNVKQWSAVTAWFREEDITKEV